MHVPLVGFGFEPAEAAPGNSTVTASMGMARAETSVRAVRERERCMRFPLIYDIDVRVILCLDSCDLIVIFWEALVRDDHAQSRDHYDEMNSGDSSAGTSGSGTRWKRASQLESGWRRLEVLFLHAADRRQTEVGCGGVDGHTGRCCASVGCRSPCPA